MYSMNEKEKVARELARVIDEIVETLPREMRRGWAGYYMRRGGVDIVVYALESGIWGGMPRIDWIWGEPGIQPWVSGSHRYREVARIRLSVDDLYARGYGPGAFYFLGRDDLRDILDMVLNS